MRELVPNVQTLELGRKECTSKEYYSFASLLGVSLAVAEGADAKGPVRQLLLPSSQGGEADGQFDRVVRSVLDAKGYADVRVIAPDVELLPCNLDDPEGFFVHMLAGDVVWAAEPGLRAGLRKRLTKPGLSLDDVLACAQEVGAQASAGETAAAGAASRKTLAVVGEWPLVVGDELTGGLFAQLEAEGYRVVRAPFAEYLLFIWEDGCDEAKHAKGVGGLMPMLGETGTPKTVGLPDTPASADPDQALAIADVQALASGFGAACANALGGCDGSHDHGAAAAALETGPLEVGADVQANPLFGAEQRTLPQDEWHALLARLADMMAQVSDALGAESPYAGDQTALRQVATDALGQFAGANARYRYAKAVQAGDRVDGIIEVASTYENVDIMLRLKGIPTKAPLLHLAFDGALDQSVEERLRSFLYYV